MVLDWAAISVRKSSNVMASRPALNHFTANTDWLGKLLDILYYNILAKADVKCPASKFISDVEKKKSFR